MRKTLIAICWIISIPYSTNVAQAVNGRPVVEIYADTLEDKIRGGMLGQVLGNLNGLPHEFKYISTPGNVEHYTPSLPQGAHTDDDTDIEWVYLRAIAQAGQSALPPQHIVQLWKRHINRRIFCANRYARQLMEIGLDPPWTGHPSLNPWAEFNISGQFLCESFGLMAPAMPETAARLGVHYTGVAISGEPAQATQLFATMLASAYIDDDIERIIAAGLAAVDSRAEISEIVRTTRAICKAHPDDWRAARGEIMQRWQTHGGSIRDSNGYELNTASAIAALTYGRTDFVETLRIAFNFGWDCDNNAATVGAIVGVIRGRRWMNAQNWDIADIYRNTTRDEMPQNETLTGLENTLVQCAQVVIKEQGGTIADLDGRRSYRIRSERPRNVVPLVSPPDVAPALREYFAATLAETFVQLPPAPARAAYIAICIDETELVAKELPVEWKAAMNDLQNRPELLRVLFESRGETGKKLQQRARHAGLQPLDNQ